jgi:hypothetical protein
MVRDNTAEPGIVQPIFLKIPQNCIAANGPAKACIRPIGVIRAP